MRSLILFAAAVFVMLAPAQIAEIVQSIDWQGVFSGRRGRGAIYLSTAAAEAPVRTRPEQS